MSELEVIHPGKAGDGASRAQAFLDFRFVAAEPESDLLPEVAVAVPVRALHGTAERWQSAAPVTAGQLGPFAAASTDELLALSGSRAVAPGRLAEATRRWYVEAMRLLRREGYPHLVRVWNFVPDINGGCGEAEAYKRFCAGRAAALRQLEVDPASLPAASALGGPAGAPLQITFLGSRTPGLNLENPRQQSAYRYPPRYGREPPAFARATVHGRRLLISGTAAIVGHESQHPGNVHGQLRCALDNLLLLLDHACAEANARWVDDLRARVYLRHAEDLDSVRGALATDLPNLSSAVFLQADVCRRELLVEVEATGVLRGRV